jgi:hypothetical protein
MGFAIERNRPPPRLRVFPWRPAWALGGRGVRRFCAGDDVIEASSLAELGELVKRALADCDPIAWLRASGGRLLTDDEFATVLARLGK